MSLLARWDIRSERTQKLETEKTEHTGRWKEVCFSKSETQHWRLLEKPKLWNMSWNYRFQYEYGELDKREWVWLARFISQILNAWWRAINNNQHVLEELSIDLISIIVFGEKYQSHWNMNRAGNQTECKLLLFLRKWLHAFELHWLEIAGLCCVTHLLCDPANYLNCTCLGYPKNYATSNSLLLLCTITCWTNGMLDEIIMTASSFFLKYNMLLFWSI